MPRRKTGQGQRFGGPWTELKLDRLKGYLEAYLKVMKKHRDHFTLVYIDAFAGAGKRYQVEGGRGQREASLLSLPETGKSFFDGSAQIALNLSPGFDVYAFIDQDKNNIAALAQLNRADARAAVKTYQRDANEAIQDLCARGNWHGTQPGKRLAKGVIFLDPFGMDVTWETIEAIARTGALDMWYLFPSGLGVGRMAARDPERIPEAWSACLDRCLGTGEWRQAWYQTETEDTLFGEERQKRRKADVAAIETFFVERLKTVFPTVAPVPLRLPNSRGYTMFSLCFASGAEPDKGGKPALNIARHLLERMPS